MQSTAEPTRSYRVLSHAEREEIMIGRRTGQSLRDIAKRLGRNVSVISREIRANSTEDGRYQAFWANARSTRRRKLSRTRPRIRDSAVQEYVEQHLKLGWSPEQIAGRLPIDHPEKRVSYETIYQFIFKTRRDLTQYLQCGRKQRRKRKDPRKKRVLIPQRTGIEQRPAQMRRSITFDNGQENRHHTTMRDALNLDTYFCEPYSSWQKGSVEHAVGLTRRFWPKKTDYALIPEEEIAMVEYRLNTRPRKRFGFLSPLEYTFCVALTA